MRSAVVFLLVVGVLSSAPMIAAGQSGAGVAFQNGLAAYRSGNVEGAIPALERALAADSSQERAYVVLASALLRTSQPERALQVADAGLDRFPDRPALHLARAQAFSAQEQWEAALEVYRRVEREHERGTALPPRISIEQVRSRIGGLHRLLGQKQIRDGQLDAALSHFKEARARLPDSAATHADVAAVFLKQRRWQSAADAAEQGLDRAPNHPRLLRLRGEALMRAGQTEAAVSDLGRLYQRRPDDVNVGLTYGRVLLASGQTTAGRKVFETLLDRHPRETKIYDTLIALNERQLNYDGALQVLRRQRQQFPEDPDLAMQEGRLLEKMGKYEAARRVYDSTQVEGTPDDVSPLMAAAGTYVEQDRLDDAAEAYRRVLARDSLHTDALRALGRVYEKQERWTDALAVYHRLRDTLDDPAEVYVKLGQVYEALGEPTEALRTYRTATDHGADHPKAYVRYAVLRHEHGDGPAPFEVAERALRKSLQALETLQKKQLQQLQKTTSQTGDSASGALPDRDKLKAYDAIAVEAFRFFAEAFPPERTEPVILDLLNEHDDAGQLHYLTGVYYRNQGRTDDALDHLRQAVQESSELRRAHLALGELYAEQGAVRKAIRSYERARSLDPGAHDAYRALLGLYQQRGALETLIQRWQARYRTDPDNEVLREHLIEALHKAERYEAARALARTDSTAE